MNEAANNGWLNIPPSQPVLPNREKRREAMDRFITKFNSEGWVYYPDMGSCFCADCWEKFSNHPKTREFFGSEKPNGSSMSAGAAKQSFQSEKGYSVACASVEGEEKCEEKISEDF